MVTKVAIIGKGQGWDKAPPCGKGVEIWGVNNLCLRRPVDVAFNMHDLDKHKDHNLFKETIKHVNKRKIPIITQREYPHILLSIKFPLDKFKRQYFTNSIDYMVAYACYASLSLAEYMYLSYLDLYGVVMAVGTEYEMQRPSLEYWLGLADGMFRVTVHEPTMLFKHPKRKGLYGYDWDEEDEEWVKNRSENQSNGE